MLTKKYLDLRKTVELICIEKLAIKEHFTYKN